MSVSPYIDEEERASQVLRASVVDAAMKLGPGVTGWMFDNAVAEEDEEEEQQVSTPGLVSSASSEDSHSTALSSPIGNDHTLSRPMISYPTKLTPLNSFEQGYYLNSPFVVVDQEHFPRFQNVPGYPYVPPIDTTNIPRPMGLSSAPAVSSETKKPSKGFKFSPKKPSSRAPSSQGSTQESLSRRTSPVTSPVSHPDTVSRSATPTSRAASPGLSATARNPGKLKKIRPGVTWKNGEAPPGAQGWDFKDPDRPSFFAVEDHRPSDPPRSSSALGHADAPKGKKKAKKATIAGDKDDGYMSEGTGKAKARAKKDKEKEKETRPPMKRSMTSRLMSKLSNSDLQTTMQPEPQPPVPPLPHPIHDKFASARTVTPEREQPGAVQVQTVKNQLSAEWRKVQPAELDRSPYLKASNAGSRLEVPAAEPSPASSTSSFAMVPDMNAVNRRMQQLGHSDGYSVGSDNEQKLAMLAKLITDAPPAPAIEVHSPRDSGIFQPEPEQIQDIEVPSSGFIVPSPTVERRPSSAVMRYYDVPLSPKAPVATPRPPPSAASRNRFLASASKELHVDPSLPTSPEGARSGSAPPTMLNHQIKVRGRQAPFPTKPILPTQGANLKRSASQTHLARNPVLAKNPQFLTPKRYENTLAVPGSYERPDVPRSVRSSYSKDLEREEEADERDDQSVYSMGSRASFMDVGKSTEAREKLVRGVGAISRGQEPRWF